MIRTRLAHFFSAVLFSGLTFTATAEDWPQWYGPQRDGVLREKGIVKEFTKENSKVLWRKPIGGGYAGPAVANGRLFVMDRPALPANAVPAGKDGKPAETKQTDAARKLAKAADKERVICLNVLTGEPNWIHEYDCKYKVSYPSGPRATISVDGENVYALGAMGDLWCLNASDGKVLWSRHFLKDFKLKQPPAWGWSSPPLVDGDQLICLVGGENSAVVAFDKKTGKEIWKALNTEEICYAPPIMIDHDGKRELLIWHSDAIAGLDPKSGKELWSVPYPIEGGKQRPEVTIAQPRQIGDRLFFTSFYQGSLMLKLEKDKPTVVWKTTGALNPKTSEGLMTTMCTPVIKDEHIYGICGFGEFRCLDAKDGKRIWESYQAIGGEKSLFAHAFITPHEDRYILWTDQGNLISAKLTPKGYEETSRVHILDTTSFTRGRHIVWCSPAFANGMLFVRNEKEIVCVSIAEKS